MMLRVARHIPPAAAAWTGGAARRTFASTTRRLDTDRVQVQGSGTGGTQHMTIPDTPYRITADTYKQFGGNESAPSPLHYSLAALASCTQVTGVIVAKDLGIELGKWDVAVDGDWDPAVLVTGVEGNAGWQAVTVRVKVATNADDATFDKWTKDTERRCPISQLYKKGGVNFKTEWLKETKT